MYLCKYDLSKECKGSQRDCVECVVENIKTEIENIREDVLYSTSDYSPNEVLDILDDILDRL